MEVRVFSIFMRILSIKFSFKKVFALLMVSSNRYLFSLEMRNTENIKIPLVSVIIPVYNTAPYLEKTLQSIMDQTLYKIEILIFDDGSTDQSLNIIKKIALQDSRIKVYSHTNQGLSVTRNIGIEKSQGEFIYFMDSDDLLEPETLEECYLKCVQENLDFVFFNAESFCEETISLRQYHYSKINDIEDTVWNGKELLAYLDRIWAFQPSACLTFTRSNFLKLHNIHFFPNILHEDQLYTALLYLNANRVKYINKTFFKRRVRTNSITTLKITLNNIKGYFTTADILLYYTANKSTKKLIHNHLSIMLNAAIRQAAYLSIREKIYILNKIITKYLFLINIKTIIILITKKILKNI